MEEELKIQGEAKYFLANFEVFEIGRSPPYKTLELVIWGQLFKAGLALILG